MPELPVDQGQTFGDEDMLPCNGAWDVQIEWYHRPCPDCTGEEPHLPQGLPASTESHRFNTTPKWANVQADVLRVVTERAAESLAKTIHCWVDMHWSPDMTLGEDVDAPDLAKQIVSTCCELVCVENVSHGPRITSVGAPGGELQDIFGQPCSCSLNDDVHLQNFATKMRQEMNVQTTTGYNHFLFWSEWSSHQGEDTVEHMPRVPIPDWNENPFFELENLPPLPGEEAGRNYDRTHPLAGLFSAAFYSRWRMGGLQGIEKWVARRDETFPVLKHVEPWSLERYASRRNSLIDSIWPDLQQPGVNTAQRWVCETILFKIAEILAYDSGLVKYRIELIMKHFVDAMVEVLESYPADQATGATGTMRRPPFGPNHVHSLFHLLLMNAENFAVPQNTKLFILREHVTDLHPVHDFPHWVRPEIQWPQFETDAVTDWRGDCRKEAKALKMRLALVSDHIVRYIPGRLTDCCTMCRTKDNMEPNHRGPQICRDCRVRAGYSGDVAKFGDQNFLDRVANNGPVSEWECLGCLGNFTDNEPPCEVPAELIRCHGRHASTSFGSLCLQKWLLARDRNASEKQRVPSCPMCRGGLTEWDQNILADLGELNDDDWMDPSAYYQAYGSLDAGSGWGRDAAWYESATIFPDDHE